MNPDRDGGIERPAGNVADSEPDAINNAIGYAKFRSRSHDAVIRVTMKRAT